jgi:hypothetical protein
MEEAIKALYSIRLAERIATASEVQGVNNWKESAWQILMHNVIRFMSVLNVALGTHVEAKMFTFNLGCTHVIVKRCLSGSFIC